MSIPFLQNFSLFLRIFFLIYRESAERRRDLALGRPREGRKAENLRVNFAILSKSGEKAVTKFTGKATILIEGPLCGKGGARVCGKSVNQIYRKAAIPTEGRFAEKEVRA